MPTKCKISRRKRSTRKNKSKKQKGGATNTEFMDAIRNADLEYVRTNIRSIRDLSFEDVDGYTPLDTAINGYNSLTRPISDADSFGRFTTYQNIIKLLLANGANGENIELPNFNFSNMKLKNVNLQNSKLSGSKMYNVNLEGAQLQNSDLSKVDLTNATLELTNLTNTNFTGAILDNTNFDNAVIDGTIFTNTLLEETGDDDSFLDTILNNPNLTNNITLTTNLPEEEIIPRSPDQSPPYPYTLNSPDWQPASTPPQRYIRNSSDEHDWMLDLIDRGGPYSDENQVLSRMSLSELEADEDEDEERKERLRHIRYTKNKSISNVPK